MGIVLFSLITLDNPFNPTHDPKGQREIMLAIREKGYALPYVDTPTVHYKYAEFLISRMLKKVLQDFLLARTQKRGLQLGKFYHILGRSYSINRVLHANQIEIVYSFSFEINLRSINSAKTRAREKCDCCTR
jgi:hypothetical protein